MCIELRLFDGPRSPGNPPVPSAMIIRRNDTSPPPGAIKGVPADKQGDYGRATCSLDSC